MWGGGSHDQLLVLCLVLGVWVLGGCVFGFSVKMLGVWSVRVKCLGC